MSTAWKATERFVASVLGGTRVPITGRQRGDVPDIAHPRYSIEVKRRSAPTAFPSWLTFAIHKAEGEGREAVVLIDDERGPLVILRLNHFVDLVNGDACA